MWQKPDVCCGAESLAIAAVGGGVYPRRVTSPGVAIPRHELIATALELGIERPETLTQQQLVERIQRASENPGRPDPGSEGSGWLSVARHLVARVVEQGLNMPEAAKLIGGSKSSAQQRAPLPTVTLAQIYISQGHLGRARSTLRAVLDREPENPKARALLERLKRQETDATLPPPSSALQRDEPSTAEPSTAEPSTAEPSTAEPAPQDEPSPSQAAPEGQSDRLASEPAAVAEAPQEREQSKAVAIERDALVLVRAEQQAHLYWELSARSARRLQDQPFRAVIRTYQPAEYGAEMTEAVVDITEPSGLHSFACPAQQVVRAVLGVLGSEPNADPPDLEPLAVASSRCIAEDGLLQLEFTPRESLRDVAVAERARARIGL